ncbi:methionine ABC transporter ATP-binding protein [Rouxiella sp. Mn2063]|uniref:methionine ABC transporter ATP-binding protein n=1 Tax=Rouxiella sp. Mn2063 TaxID=3395262 RepID=UPI003BD49DE5
MTNRVHNTDSPAVHIRLENINKYYPNGVHALHNISLDIRRGEIFGIIGRSGAGKSTLLRMLNRLEDPGDGSIIIDEENIGEFSSPQLLSLRRRVAMIFQHFNLMATKTVAENIELPLRMAAVARAERKQRVQDMLRLVGLESHQHSWPAQLSGGQKQRVGIARALVLQPEILLCDEATSALDPENTQTILALLRDINQRLGLTIVLITHEMDVIRTLCDRVAVLEQGRLIEQGEVWRVFGAPEHEVTHKLLGTMHYSRFDNQSDASTNQQLLTLHYTGVSGQEPSLATIAATLGENAHLLYSNCEQIQGRVIGQLQVRVDTTSVDAILAQSGRIADRIEVVS